MSSLFELQHPIAVLKGIGPKTREILVKSGIHTIEDFLYFFPRAWIDASQVKPISELRNEQSGLIRATVVTVKEGMSQKGHLPYLRATVADTNGSLDVMWFHARYLKPKIKPGATFLLYGRVHSWRAGERTMVAPKFMDKPEIMPLYSEVGGLASSRMHSIFGQLQELMQELPDHLPESVRKKVSVVSLGEALMGMHFPETLEDIQKAKQRFGFEELLMTTAPSAIAKQQREREVTQAVTGGSELVGEWLKTLPFTPTGGQRQAIDEVLVDMAQTSPMNRLLQGDVGSGKTVVGIAAALQAVLAGKQVVWLAPTELLAGQHFRTIQSLCAPLLSNGTLTVGLWTRSQKHKIQGGEVGDLSVKEISTIGLMVGTHALLSEKIEFPHIGLLIIDEQHRFGVKQRSQLRLLSGKPVHLLSMTATPIPRTMALLVYGDLELSVIKEKPVGRKSVVTKVVGNQNRLKAYEFIDGLIAKGQQVYVVCPSIEPTQDAEANVFTQLFETVEEKKAVTTWAVELQRHFPARSIGILHGKLKAQEKEAVMDQFRSGKLDILVSTTVIEVGVDVPNATVMMIESAERFGLAQLHQLRGRVGRGDVQSFCLLFPTGDKENDRLKTMEETSDGFVLAQKDLELRGPGELTGLAQSGLPTLKFATFNDLEKIQQIKDILPELLQDPAFQKSIDRFWRIYHPE